MIRLPQFITAQGLGAMGALRISGPAAFDVAAKVFRSQRGRRIEDLAGYSLTYGHVFSGEECLDQALLLKMAGPYSFTGEDVAELQCHGGPFVLSRLFAAVLAAGARGAEPGEFSKARFFKWQIGFKPSGSHHGFGQRFQSNCSLCCG